MTDIDSLQEIGPSAARGGTSNVESKPQQDEVARLTIEVSVRACVCACACVHECVGLCVNLFVCLFLHVFVYESILSHIILYRMYT